MNESSYFPAPRKSDKTRVLQTSARARLRLVTTLAGALGVPSKQRAGRRSAWTHPQWGHIAAVTAPPSEAPAREWEKLPRRVEHGSTLRNVLGRVPGTGKCASADRTGCAATGPHGRADGGAQWGFGGRRKAVLLGLCC